MTREIDKILKDLNSSDDTDQKEYESLLGDVRKVMGDQSGRNVIWYILQIAGIYRTAEGPESAVNYINGQRDIGLRVLDLLDDCDPSMYSKLLLERSRKK